MLEALSKVTVDGWLKQKRLKDGAEGLWRIHDDLYDVSDFVDSHPGGRFWLETTKGIDATEAFEAHHLNSSLPEKMLDKFYVRKAVIPRNSPYTFKSDGFYKTVKRRAREALKNISHKDARLSDLYIDLLITAYITTALLSVAFCNYKIAVLSGCVCALSINAAHNYCHRRNNFRILYVDLCGLNSRELRIIHILSHHLHPNSTIDMQAYFAEPFVVYFPRNKSFGVRYLSWIYEPLLLWPFTIHIATILRLFGWCYFRRIYKLEVADVLPLLVPSVMCVLGRQTLLETALLWQTSVLVTSVTFCLLAFTTTHIHPDVYMEGDALRRENEMDWGIYQLDSVADRPEVNRNKFLVLTCFGEHAMHHLFPTLDHSIIHHLYPVVEKTMKEFNLSMRLLTSTELFLGHFRRLALEKGNSMLPSLPKIKI